LSKALQQPWKYLKDPENPKINQSAKFYLMILQSKIVQPDSLTLKITSTPRLPIVIDYTRDTKRRKEKKRGKNREKHKDKYMHSD